MKEATFTLLQADEMTECVMHVQLSPLIRKIYQNTFDHAQDHNFQKKNYLLLYNVGNLTLRWFRIK